uniref:CCHC-type domain-containing protein n=1 Tax=Syphacia muris TaxID=451379 RepID=A0A0N5AZ27_9BILA
MEYCKTIFIPIKLDEMIKMGKTSEKPKVRSEIPRKGDLLNKFKRGIEDRPFTSDRQVVSGTPGKPCLFCQGEHFNDECTKYSSLSARMKRLQKLHLCVSCLKSGRVRKKCRTNQKSCFYCKSFDHKGAVCPVKFDLTKNNSSETSVK